MCFVTEDPVPGNGTIEITAGRAVNTPTRDVAQRFPLEDLFPLVPEVFQLELSMTLTALGRFLKGNFFQAFGGDEENIEGEALLPWSRRLNGGVWVHGHGKTCLIWGKK